VAGGGAGDASRCDISVGGALAVRIRALEAALAGAERSLDARLDAAVGRLPGPVVEDIHGSADYRRFVLRHALSACVQRLGG
jgi:CO/xanthine dehydrogenase FAD-binding subunit